MKNTPSPVLLSVLALLLAAGGSAAARSLNASRPRSKQRPVLFLNFANNGQHLTAKVGQQIEIRLGTVGPRQYGAPIISSPAIQLLNIAQDWPANPGGPSFVYVLAAAAEGEARVEVRADNPGNAPFTNDLTFTVTIRVRPAAHILAQRRMMIPDQANTAPWKNAWTNLNNNARQTFTPSRPRLTGVEVELVAANPGSTNAAVSMMVLNEEGFGLARVLKTVQVADCRHVLFVLPRGGLPVSPGRVYSIALNSEGNVFGWKYVVGGYANGEAWLNNKPLLLGARSTFLFRTFGAR